MLRQGDEPVPGYHLECPIGRGGFGEVWRAMGPGRTKVALKFINLDDKPGRKELRAIGSITKVRHAHLLPIHGYWILDAHGRLLDDELLEASSTVALPAGGPDAPAPRAATLVVAMTLADSSLKDLLERRQADGNAGIPLHELLRYLDDTARAIDYLNSPRHDLGSGPTGIQHCDIKPQNILLLGDCACVCDFGLVQVLSESATSGINGTPAYMPPERISGDGPAATSDQYSLAITYYELRTGRLPLTFSNPVEAFHAHVQQRLDFGGVSAAEERVLRRATAFNPQARYASTLVLMEQLRQAVAPLYQPVSQFEPTISRAPGGAPPADAGPPRERASVVASPPASPPSGSELAIRVVSFGPAHFEFHTSPPPASEGHGDDAPDISRLSSQIAWNVRQELLELLTTAASGSEHALAQFGRYAFRMCLPERVQERIMQHAGLITVSGSSPLLPWELMHDGGGFAVLRQGLLRSVTAAQPAQRPARALLIDAASDDFPQARREREELQHIFRRHQIQVEVLAPPQCQLLPVFDRMASGQFDLLHFLAAEADEPEPGQYHLALPGDQLLAVDDVTRALRNDVVLTMNIWPREPLAKAEELGERIEHRLQMKDQLHTGSRFGRATCIALPVWWGLNQPVTGFFAEFYERLLSGHSLAAATTLTRTRLQSKFDDFRQVLGVAVSGPGSFLFAPPHEPGSAREVSSRQVTPTLGPVESLLHQLLGDEGRVTPAVRLILTAAVVARKAAKATCLDLSHLWQGLLTVPNGAIPAALASSGKNVDELLAQLKNLPAEPHPSDQLVNGAVKQAFVLAQFQALRRNADELSELELFEALLARTDPATQVVKRCLTSLATENSRPNDAERETS